MNERDKLIIQLLKVTAGNNPFFLSDLEAIADFIILDRKRICEPLIEANRISDEIGNKERG